jgi:HAD superfamily hydrolase (TIGR01549 family)
MAVAARPAGRPGGSRIVANKPGIVFPNGTENHRRGVVFDFDGTLVDSYPLIEEAFSTVMQTHALDERARLLFRQSRGLPLPEQMRRISPDLWEDLVATYRRADSRLGPAHVFRGIPTVVRTLRRRGIRLGVVSCKRRALVEAELEGIGLQRYFDVVIGYEDVSPPKPAPDPLLAALQQLELGRGNTLYVGDSVVDMETGQAAQVRTVLAAWGHSADMNGEFSRYSLRARRPRELLGLIDELNSNGRKPAA